MITANVLSARRDLYESTQDEYRRTFTHEPDDAVAVFRARIVRHRAVWWRRVLCAMLGRG